MAPSEFELRAALHDGEGEEVNAGRVIARARAVRATRRTRWATVAASVVVVGALGTGIGALAHHGGSQSAGSAAGANSADSAAGPGAGAPARAAAPQPAAPEAGAANGPSHGLAQGGFGSTIGMCPPRPPRVRVPEPGARGTSDPLFARTVSSVTVCGFRAKRAGGAPVFDRATVLTGARAQRLADSLDRAARTYRAVPCAPDVYSTSLALYAGTGTQRPRPVLVEQACGGTVTDGTAARYDWTPPADLAAKLDALTQP